MKSILFSALALVSISAFSSTYDSYTLPVTGAEALENFTLNTVQTRTEYTTETVAKTCYRTVQRGYEQQCRVEPEMFCYNVKPVPPRHPKPGHNPGHRPSRPDYAPKHTVCDTRWVTRCHSVPRYVQEAYTCYETVRTPYEVFSHNVKTNVTVKIENQAKEVLAPHNTCNVNFSSTGQSFEAKANCSEFIVLAKTEDQLKKLGDTVVVEKLVNLTLLDQNKVTSPTANGIGEMRLEGQTLVFRTGDLNKNSNIALKLFVERRKLLKSDQTLINRVLSKGEYSFEKTGEDSGVVRVNLQKLLGGINKKRKHVIKVDLNVLTSVSNSINSSLPKLSASQSITVND